MLDWKILAAGIAALILVAAFVAGDSQTNFLSDIINRIGGFLGSSPFGGLFSSTEEPQPVDIIIYPENLSLHLDKNNITLNSIELSEFTGDVSIDFSNKKISLSQKGSQLKLTAPIEKVTIEGLKIPKLLAENMRLEVVSGKYNITSNNGTIEVFNFFGQATITPQNIELMGNVTKIERK